MNGRVEMSGVEGESHGPIKQFRRTWLSLLAVLFAFSVTLGAASAELWSVQPAAAAACPNADEHKYVAQLSTVAAYGVDGYVGYPAGGISNPACNAVAQFLNVSPSNGNPSTWLQVGVHVGAVDTSGSNYNASPVVYVENLRKANCMASYHRVFFGAPSGINKAYYAYFDGAAPVSLTYCGSSGTYYEYVTEKDSYLSPPLAYGWLTTASPQWSAQVEVVSLTNPYSWEWNGTRSFGNPSDQIGYGLGWFDQPNSSWGTWALSNGATIIDNYPSSPPIRHCPQVSYRAFQAKWSSC